MKNITLLILLFVLFKVHAQVAIFGTLYINQIEVKNATVTIYDKDKVIQTNKTESKSTFSFEVGFGPDYTIYIDQPEAFRTFFTLETSRVPEKMHGSCLLAHNMDAMLISKHAVDVDSTAFHKPFYKIIYDSRKRMVSDEDYSASFQKTIYKVR